MRWLAREVSDLLMAAWLVAGAAAILWLLADDLVVAGLALAAFVGGTLVLYFRLARRVTRDMERS